MKRFMHENVITHNLMSFSAFKGLLIFTLLIEKPYSYAEIQKCFEENEYLHESVSKDTIRNYMNSLKAIGCEIKRIKDGKFSKYYISQHPFELKINEKQVESVLKIYKAISGFIDISDFMALQSFFDKISSLITNEKLKNQLQNLSPISNISPKLIEELKYHTDNNNEITVFYNSGNSGWKNITILANDMYISNQKLYIAGINSEYNNYSSFLVSKIKKIISVNLGEKVLIMPKIKVQYELKKSDNTEFELLDNEKIISENENKKIIEI